MQTNFFRSMWHFPSLSEVYTTLCWFIIWNPVTHWQVCGWNVAKGEKWFDCFAGNCAFEVLFFSSAKAFPSFFRVWGSVGGHTEPPGERKRRQCARTMCEQRGGRRRQRDNRGKYCVEKKWGERGLDGWLLCRECEDKRYDVGAVEQLETRKTGRYCQMLRFLSPDMDQDPRFLTVDDRRWRSDTKGSSSSIEPSMSSFNSEVEEEELACSMEPSVQDNQYLHFNGNLNGMIAFYYRQIIWVWIK